MRRFTFSSEHSPVSSEDLAGKCELFSKDTPSFPEYERIFTSTSSFSPDFSQDAAKRAVPEKKAGPIRKIKVKGFADDFYSSLLDWHGSTIVFAINERIYVHNFLTGTIHLLSRLSNTYITSIKISSDGLTVGAGTCTGDIALFDMEGHTLLRKHQHKSRIGVLEWNETQILTGSRDRSIRSIDMRMPQDMPPVTVHSQEVCGLSYSPDKTYLASGGNDNKVFILDGRSPSSITQTLTAHRAAVKAIGWCPNRSGFLATGGGTADRTIKMWKVSGAFEQMTDSIDYGSQICNIRWTQRNELITTHGYSQNDIRVLDVTRKRQTRLFEGHKNRVIHFGMSTDEEYFATGSGDETVCVWRASETNLSEYLIR